MTDFADDLNRNETHERPESDETHESDGSGATGETNDGRTLHQATGDDATTSEAVSASAESPEPDSSDPITTVEGLTAEGEAMPMRSGFVAILGKPNVGKSTLLNTLLGVKVAPITSKPQTTRVGVRGIHTNVAERRQLVFVDTPGLHQGRTALDSFMTREIRGAVADVEMILWVVDLRRPPGNEDREVGRLLKGLDPDTPIFLVGNKLDVAKYPDEAMNLYAELGPEPSRRYMLSALDDPKAVHDLRADLLDLLPESPYYFPENMSSDQSREQWAAELIRESTMTHLYQEIPYTVAIRVTDWLEPEPDKDEPLVIAAEIWVEKRQHRPIVIGRGGRMIREIGRTARKQLEIFLDRKIFLDLEVVVRHDWRMDPEALRELGYG